MQHPDICYNMIAFSKVLNQFTPADTIYTNKELHTLQQLHFSILHLLALRKKTDVQTCNWSVLTNGVTLCNSPSCAALIVLDLSTA